MKLINIHWSYRPPLGWVFNRLSQERVGIYTDDGVLVYFPRATLKERLDMLRFAATLEQQRREAYDRHTAKQTGPAEANTQPV